MDEGGEAGKRVDRQRTPRRSRSAAALPAAPAPAIAVGRAVALIRARAAASRRVRGARLSESGNGLRVAHVTPMAVRSSRMRWGPRSEAGSGKSENSNRSTRKPCLPTVRPTRGNTRNRSRGSRSAQPASIAAPTAATNMMPVRRCIQTSCRNFRSIGTRRLPRRDAMCDGQSTGDRVGRPARGDARRLCRWHESNSLATHVRRTIVRSEAEFAAQVGIDIHNSVITRSLSSHFSLLHF